MVLGHVVSLEQARRKRDLLKGDPEAFARRLCQAMASISDHRPRYVSLDEIAERSGMLQDELIVGAAYAHARRWVIFVTYSVMLMNAGAAIAARHGKTRNGIRQARRLRAKYYRSAAVRVRHDDIGTSQADGGSISSSAIG